MRVGYIVKRFPRASETFIAQEILGLERLGVEVVILALRPNDRSVDHEWLAEIAAPIQTFQPQSFSDCWRDLQKASRESPARRKGIHEALLSAFDHPKRSGKRYLVESWWIEGICRELDVQHLHAHFANHPAFVAMLGHLLTGVPYSFTAHAKDIYLDGPSPELWRQQLDRAAFAVTVCQKNWLHLESLIGPSAKQKIQTVYNGVDLERIKPSRPFRGGHGQKVLFASRLIAKKGADLIVEAAIEISRRDPDVEFTVVGDGEQLPALQQVVTEAGIAARVRFTGFLPHQEVIRVMADSDLFVLPCRVAPDGDRDALPTVLLEAMAVGLPCISTPINGVPEILDQGRTGLIVSENDSSGLAAAIEQLLRDPDGRRRMGVAGRRKVERKFDLCSSTARLRDLFELAVRDYSTNHEAVVVPASVFRGIG